MRITFWKINTIAEIGIDLLILMSTRPRIKIIFNRHFRRLSILIQLGKYERPMFHYNLKQILCLFAKFTTTIKYVFYQRLGTL